MRYAEYRERIAMLVEYREIYDGWSVAVLKDGTVVNRWENDEGTGPEPGDERRYEATQRAIEANRASLAVMAT